MNKDAALLLIDDNTSRKQNLQLILQFLGVKQIFLATSQDWRCYFPQKELTTIKGIILGAPEVLSSASALITEVGEAANRVPLLLLAEKALANKISQSLPERVAGYLTLPFTYGQVTTALHHCQIYHEHNTAFLAHTNQHLPLELYRSLVGCSAAIANARELIIKVAESDANVLILGESGTGKEVAARSIHIQSARRDKPFVPINCGAIPGELLESELFGHEKGAFTGAIATRQGRFELAAGGTIFLDEIGDMPLAMQVKLLRVIQERCFERVGSNKSTHVDVRIIAATHRDLEQEILNNHFREDLFYRLNVFPIEMPALRNRIEDLPFLINELLSRMEEQHKSSVHLTPQAIEALGHYSWPGNIRELANLMERLAILYPNGVVDEEDLPVKVRPGQPHDSANHSVLTHDNFPHSFPQLDLKDNLTQTELRLIKQALEQAKGDIAKAATLLNIRKATLVEKLRKYDLTVVDQVATEG